MQNLIGEIMKTFDEVPNLDCLDIADLKEFKAYLLYCTDQPQKWFQNADHDSVHKLFKYTDFKINAKNCRLDGDIYSAMRFEKKCDAIYSQLPDYAKW